MTEKQKAWHVKIRPKGERAFWFLTSNGGMNRLRIHAARWTDLSKANQFAQMVQHDNPGCETKVVRA